MRTKQKDKQVILEQAVLSLLQKRPFTKLTLDELGHLSNLLLDTNNRDAQES